MQNQFRYTSSFSKCNNSENDNKKKENVIKSLLIFWGGGGKKTFFDLNVINFSGIFILFRRESDFMTQRLHYPAKVTVENRGTPTRTQTAKNLETRNSRKSHPFLQMVMQN